MFQLLIPLSLKTMIILALIESLNLLIKYQLHYHLLFVSISQIVLLGNC